jgi:hypothetical protein
MGRTEFAPNSLEIGAQMRIGLLRRHRTRDEQNVEVRQPTAVHPKTFADHSTNAISLDGALRHATGDGDAQPRATLRRRSIFGDEYTRTQPLALLAQAGEIAASQKSRVAWQTKRRHRRKTIKE